MAAPHAFALLRDVFEITGRGVVIVVGDIEGVIRIGDVAAFGDLETEVSGIEMINVADPAAHPTDTTGLLVKGIGKDAIRHLTGSRFSFCRKG